MRRRDVVRLLAGAAAAAFPAAARAQQPKKTARIGYLSVEPATSRVSAYNDAFLAGLRDLGYVEGRNIHIEFRDAGGDDKLVPKLAAELVDLKVDVLVTYGTGIVPARRATATIPIVMTVGPDVVAMGLVESFAHPGGNLTGLTFFYPELMAKRLELLRQVVPSISAAGVLLHRNNPSTANVLDVMGKTARAMKVGLQAAEIDGPQELEGVFSVWENAQVGGFVTSDRLLISANAIGPLALKHRLASAGGVEVANSGGLLGYGVDFRAIFRRAAVLVDKILKGTKPGDIPIEQPSNFKLVVNLKTAKGLGLEVPPTMLATADEVIE